MSVVEATKQKGVGLVVVVLVTLAQCSCVVVIFDLFLSMSSPAAHFFLPLDIAQHRMNINTHSFAQSEKESRKKYSH